ncbi:MAG: anti-sigma factor domain-containing protein [Paracoccaceae bacterium]
MARADDREIDAAERALGTLPVPDRESARDAALREAWETRLAGLTAVLPPATPPAGLFYAIEARIERDALVADLDVERRRRRRWQRMAMGLGASVAAALLLLLVAPDVEPAPRYVVVVTADDDPTRAGLVIQIDPETGAATVVPTGVEVPPGASFEMWHLPEGAERPYSLGLLPDAPRLREIDAAPGDIFAISREPEGGSPSGQPTEPLFHGTMRRAE